MADSPLKLPGLTQAVLDAGTLAALFTDLATCTQILAVVPKRVARAMAEEPPIDLPTAHRDLREGALRAVQVRYRYEGREWCDTLMPLAGGSARLVRICTDEVYASAS